MGRCSQCGKKECCGTDYEDFMSRLYTALHGIIGDRPDDDEVIDAVRGMSELIHQAGGVDELKRIIGSRSGYTGSGAARIGWERARQMQVEGWTPQHDDTHTDGELWRAAVCYIETQGGETIPAKWPTLWAASWKPKDRMSNLIRAGALIAAEIDRINRMSAQAAGKGE